MLYKIVNGLVDINFNDYYKWTNKRLLRTANQLQLDVKFTRTDVLKHSFVTESANEWNKLPQHVVSSETLGIFKSQLMKYLLSSHLNCVICANV